LPDANVFNEHEDNHEVEEQNSHPTKQSNNCNKMISHEDEHPNFNENYNSIDKNIQKARIYSLAESKTKDYEVNKYNDDVLMQDRDKNKIMYEG
jgi:hypothetical protein